MADDKRLPAAGGTLKEIGPSFQAIQTEYWLHPPPRGANGAAMRNYNDNYVKDAKTRTARMRKK